MTQVRKVTNKKEKKNREVCSAMTAGRLICYLLLVLSIVVIVCSAGLVAYGCMPFVPTLVVFCVILAVDLFFLAGFRSRGKWEDQHNNHAGDMW